VRDGSGALPGALPGALRIEMLLPSLARAGMEVVAAELARELRARGHQVAFTVIEEVGDLGGELRDEGFRVTHVPAPGLRPNVMAGALGHWLRTVRPDVVHAHSGLWLKAAQAARSAGVDRVILTLHGVPPREGTVARLYKRVACARVDEVVAVSESLRTYLVDRVRVPEGRVSFIPNGVCTRRFAPARPDGDGRTALGIPRDACVIGKVARLHPVKNHGLLLEAFAAFAAEVPSAFLLLVGDGALRDDVARQAHRLGIEERMLVTGVVADARPYLKQMNTFVLASHIEGMSISLLEAMAMEIPCVATAVGGNPALLDGGSRGLLVPPSSPTALTAALLACYASPEAARQRARAAREAVQTSHSLAAMAGAYEAAYRGTPVAHV
jgi:glycosyltransferase involved in cell wall biosynthesis